MYLRSLAAAATAVVAVVPVTIAQAAPATEDDSGAVTATTAARTITVPLPTGDTVTVERAAGVVQSATVHPGPGREGMSFTTSSVGPGDLSVVPSDAESLLAGGRIDPRLFDVQELIDAGYGKDGVANKDTVGLIVQHDRGAEAAEDVRTAAGPDADASRSLVRIGMTPLDPADHADAATTWDRLTDARGDALAGNATKVWLDGRLKIALDKSVPQINAPQAWADGYTGKGVTVAVLDTGADFSHPALAGRITTSADFTGTGSAQDDNGHGTHVASTVAGVDSVYKGVAPDADLAIGKVCDAGGNCSTSDLLAGIDWAVNTTHAKIVSMSLGGPDGAEDPAIPVIDDLSARTGTLFVVAAGNSGEDGVGTVEAPGAADSALSVGAVDGKDQLAAFSSRGPRPWDNAVKPDITAPGVGIVAAKLGGGFVAKSGTSMATPHVAGAAALVAQAHPDWTGEQIKSALMETAKPTDGRSPYQQGTGRVDAGRAVEQHILVSPANLTTTPGWADRSGKDVDQTVTFSNTGDADEVLDLAIERPLSPTAQPGNAGQFSVDKNQVTVPAHGTATATVTSRASIQPHGPWAAILTASHDGQPVTRTILGVNSPVPSHKVTITATTREGTPVANGSAMLVNRWTGDRYPVRITNGTGSATVPEAEYWVGMTISSGSGTDRTTTMAFTSITPEDDSATAVLDARTAQPVRARLETDHPEAQASAVQAALAAPAGGGDYTLSVVTTGATAGRSLYATPIADPDVRYRTFAVFTAPGSGSAAPSPYFYHVAHNWDGGVPADPSFSVKRKDLSDVSLTLHGQGVAAAGTTGATPDDESLLPLFIDQSVRYPSTVHDYRTPGEWLDRANVGRMSLATSTHTIAARTETLDLAAPVIGPSLPAVSFYRVADTMTWAGLPWFVDGDGTRGGTDWGAVGTATLAKDGQSIGSWSATSSKSIAVPSAAGRYTLSADLTRDVAYAKLSTRVQSVWGFDSTADSGEGTILPLTAVQYVPRGLDDLGRAALGATTRVDFQAQRTPGADEVAITDLSVQVSWDDGATWKSVKVHPANGASPQHVDLTAPAGAEFATLRTALSASDGSTLTQTITRAFGVNSTP